MMVIVMSHWATWDFHSSCNRFGSCFGSCSSSTWVNDGWRLRDANMRSQFLLSKSLRTILFVHSSPTLFQFQNHAFDPIPFFHFSAVRDSILFQGSGWFSHSSLLLGSESLYLNLLCL
jgi:hypothetical protein